MPLDEFADTLARAQSGDAPAFAELWRAYQPRLLRYLTVLSPGSAEDVASETWLQVVKGLARFTGDEAAFAAWLFTVARHRAVDEARRVGRRPEIPVADAEEDPANGHVPDAAETAMENLSTADAMSLIASLPRDQAEVVALRVVAGLDVAAVAELLGRTPGSVRTTAHRGLRRLAVTLSQRGIAEGVVTG
jgi:RNA polymerase sigma-70 factor (ECF subfamily)